MTTSLNQAAPYTFDAMSIPDFLAGFIYGFTAENHMAEIELCYNGGDDLVNRITAAIGDIKSGAFIQGAKDIGAVVDQIPIALANCEMMEDDIAGIEGYAAEFKKPVHVAEIAAKNWLLHKKKIKTDAMAVYEDMIYGAYFKAGQDAADALNLLVPYNGPTAPTLEYEVTDDWTPNELQID